LHKNKKVYTITNGYDPDQLNPGTPLSKKFSITYTGRLYREHQDPTPFFRTLKVLIDEKAIDPSVTEIHFFGDYEGWLIEDIKKYHLENIIQLHGQISREESIQKQRESQVLLLFTWNDPGQKGVYTGKVFDYLAARRPILAIGLQGSVLDDLLNQTRAGLNISAEAEIKAYILQLYREYLERGFVKYFGIPMEIEKYSHREMAKKFAEVLDEICKPGETLNN
jgi:glycosyltransferase involved in cell wall biosynthesis